VAFNIWKLYGMTEFRFRQESFYRTTKTTVMTEGRNFDSLEVAGIGIPASRIPASRIKNLCLLI